MRCEQFEKRLQRLLDRRALPSEDARLNRHARGCPQCRQILAACGRMLDGLNLMELPVPADDFPLRVVRRTRVARPSPIASRRFTAAWAAVAAGLALALLLRFAGDKNRTESAAAPSLLVARTTPPATPRVVEDHPNANNPKRQRGDNPRRQRDDNPRRQRDDGTSPKQRQGIEPASSFDLDQQPSFVLLRTWTASWSARWNPVDGLADGLTPIVTPLSIAVEEIRRTIPLGLADRPAAPSADSVQDTTRQHTPPIA